MQVITKSSFMIFLILLLLLLLLAAHSSADVIARSGCDDHCGNLSIPFPFGIGSKCSLEPSFNISCDTWSVPPKAYLSILGNNEVVEIRQDYVRVKYPNLASVCYEYEGGNETSKVVYGESRSMNLSGTAYRVSVNNTVTAIGCDDMVLGMDEVDGSYINGGCSALCLLNNDTRDLGYCPLNATSPSYACCQSPLYGGRMNSALIRGPFEVIRSCFETARSSRLLVGDGSRLFHSF